MVYIQTVKTSICSLTVDMFAVYLDRIHRPGNKAVLVHCIELPEFTKARMY